MLVLRLLPYLCKKIIRMQTLNVSWNGRLCLSNKVGDHHVLMFPSSLLTSVNHMYKIQGNLSYQKFPIKIHISFQNSVGRSWTKFMWTFRPRHEHFMNSKVLWTFMNFLEQRVTTILWRATPNIIMLAKQNYFVILILIFS